MTQPGVSQHLKKLEEVCKCQLLIRLNKGIQLTEQGQQLCVYAINLQTKEDTFLQALKFDEAFEGKCTIGCSGATAQSIYPSLALLQQQHKKLNIHLEVAPQYQILAAIKENNIELGIVTNQPDEALYHCEYLGEEQLNLFLPSEYCANTSNISEVIVQLGLINHPDAKHYLQLYFSDCGIDELAKLNVSQIKESGYVNQLSQILYPVTLGIGFTVLPSSAHRQPGNDEKFTIYQSPATVSRSLFKIQSKYKVLPARYRCVIEVIDEALKRR